MTTPETMALKEELMVSEMAETLIGSEIIKLSNEINERIRKGEEIYNLTIGDFNPTIFPIPDVLQREIVKAYKDGHTNYPVASGMPELRQAVSRFIRDEQKLDYTTDEVLISAGARPLIYGAFKTVVDPGDKVIYPAPSWNNNHYCHLSLAQGVCVETSPDSNFMPRAADLEPHVAGARLIALCSPLNPTGTAFSKAQLSEICEMVLQENKRREGREKPLYILYDQIYNLLTFDDTRHYDPVSLFPEMRNCTIFVDGISKSFAATGVRVGYSFGPAYIIRKMRAILSHVGAWAPKAEQVATAHFLENRNETTAYLASFRQRIYERLRAFYDGMTALKEQGYRVDAIAPQAAIYLTVQFDLVGKRTAAGAELKTQQDVSDYLLSEAHIALVPFSAFGSSPGSSWYRLSVGTCRTSEVATIMGLLGKALAALG